MLYHNPPYLQGPYCSSNAQTLFQSRPHITGTVPVSRCAFSSTPICCHKGPNFVPAHPPFCSF